MLLSLRIIVIFKQAEGTPLPRHFFLHLQYREFKLQTSAEVLPNDSVERGSGKKHP